MDIAGIKSALADSISAARFRLFVKPVEHTAKVQPDKGSRHSRHAKLRVPTGSWIVTMSGGMIKFPDRGLGCPVRVDGFAIAKKINDTISYELFKAFKPLLTKAAEQFKEAETAENLHNLDRIFKNFLDASSIRVDATADSILPTGNGTARFDTEDWGDQAEAVAITFTHNINGSIEEHTKSLTDALHKTLVSAVLGG